MRCFHPAHPLCAPKTHAAQDGEIVVLPNGAASAEVAFVVQYQGILVPEGAWVRVQLGKDEAQALWHACPGLRSDVSDCIWGGRAGRVVDVSENTGSQLRFSLLFGAGVHRVTTQLVRAFTLEPLGLESQREFIVRPCNIAWTGAGVREATVGAVNTFVITTDCADLADKTDFTVRFHGPSVFVADVQRADEPGTFQVRYSPMASRALGSIIGTRKHCYRYPFTYLHIYTHIHT